MYTQVSDDGGMVWYSSMSNRVYYEGDSCIVAYDASGEWASSPAWSTSTHYESVHADVISGQIYQLLDSNGNSLGK